MTDAVDHTSFTDILEFIAAAIVGPVGVRDAHALVAGAVGPPAGPGAPPRHGRAVDPRPRGAARLARRPFTRTAATRRRVARFKQANPIVSRRKVAETHTHTHTHRHSGLVVVGEKRIVPDSHWGIHKPFI